MRVGTLIAALIMFAQTICLAQETLRGVRFIRFDTPTLAPIAFVEFCRKYADDCRPQRPLFRGGKLNLTIQRFAELEGVNRNVNASILPT